MQGLYEIRRGDKRGFIDARGTVVIPPTFLWVAKFQEGMCGVCTHRDPAKNRSMYGFIDATGRQVIDPVYYSVDEFSEGLAAVCVDTWEWVFIDRSGQVVIETRYNADHGAGFRHGLANVRQGEGEHWGFIDKRGQVVIPLVYDWVYPFSDGLSLVKQNKKQFYIDANGEKLKAVKHTPHLWFSEGLACAKLGKLMGFLGTDGEWHIEPRFEYGACFAEGMCAVKLDGKYGFIDTTGELVIEAKYDDARCFHRGVTAVKVGEKWGLLDTRGGVILEPRYDFIDMEAATGDLLSAQSGKQDLYLDLTGKEISPRDLAFDPEERTRLLRTLFDPARSVEKQQVWDDSKRHYMPGFIGMRAATQHIKLVFKWLESKGLLTEDGKRSRRMAPDLDYSLNRDDVTADAADFLDRCYAEWFENEAIVNYVLDPGLKPEGDENLGEYWAAWEKARAR